MRLESFPDLRTYDFPEYVEIGGYLYRSEDVVAYGTPLTLENVREAYSKGIFPWSTPGLPLPWHSPDPRAVLFFDELKIPRSLAKARRQSGFTFTIDRDFRGVIEACAASYRPGQPGTWITREFVDVFTEAHEAGFVHSVEAWNVSGELVGGLYGVDSGGVFSGESMFHREPNASKLALLFLIDHLRSRGSTWLDIQVMTPHLKALGAKEIGRNRFLEKLKLAQQSKFSLFGSCR
ncbi:MAG TPA: leucyl/phenylalanyl-tRNA--protein transferase [Pyrinomonadaceae bacterium]|nr:leucyl/phenylalanyl-tRNA--protein transferase [Pyrinomonadaceae bacterium]